METRPEDPSAMSLYSTAMGILYVTPTITLSSAKIHTFMHNCLYFIK